MTGRATIEAVLELSAMQVAGEPHRGQRGGAIIWHGRQQGQVSLAERKVRVQRARLRRRNHLDAFGRHGLFRPPCQPGPVCGETRRPRYACRACEGVIVVAEAPARPIDGGMPTEALIVHVVVSKFCDSLPLYRQSQMLARQGITLDRSTLSNWVGSACWWLRPLYDLVVATVLSSPKIFADDTSLPVLDPGRGRTKKGFLWAYAVDDRPWCGPTHPAVAYIYAEDRKNMRPAAHLAQFTGVLQVDGYDGFKRLAGERVDQSVRLAFCWAPRSWRRSVSWASTTIRCWIPGPAANGTARRTGRSCTRS